MQMFGNFLMTAGAAGLVLLLIPLAYLATGNGIFAGLGAKLSAFFDGINNGLSRIVIWTALAMALVQITVVILRYVFGINFIWLQETIMYLFAFMFMLSGGSVLLADEHVRVDVFYRSASKRWKAWVNFIGTYLFLFPVCILMVWSAAPYVARSWSIMERSTESSGIHAVFLLKSLIPAFGVLVIMAGFSLAWRSARFLRGHEEA